MKNIVMISKMLITLIQFVCTLAMFIFVGFFELFLSKFTYSSKLIIFIISFLILLILDIVLLVKYFKKKEFLKLNNITSIISIIVSLLFMFILGFENDLTLFAVIAIIINTISLFIFNIKNKS